MTYDKTSKKRILSYAQTHSNRQAIQKFNISPFFTKDNCRLENFERWFEGDFLPKIPADIVIVMDNARFHRKKVLFELLKTYNAWYETNLSSLFLPPYSPDFNPMERFFWGGQKSFQENDKDF